MKWVLLVCSLMPALLFGVVGYLQFHIPHHQASAWCFTGAAVLYAFTAYGRWRRSEEVAHG